MIQKVYCHSCMYRILEDFDRELEHTDSRLRALTKRVELAIKKTSG